MKNILLSSEKYEAFLKLLREKMDEQASLNKEVDILKKRQLKRLYLYLQETENCQYDIANDLFEIYIENDEIEELFQIMFDILV